MPSGRDPVKATQIPQKTRELLAARSHGMCEVCWQETATDAHHRQPRGMGGTANKRKHRLSNLLAVGRNCHNRIETERSTALLTEHGWLVSHYDDPAAVPALIYTASYYGPVRCYLLDNGDLRPAPEEAQEEMTA